MYLFIDAETNGLWGEPFAIAAILTDDSGKVVEDWSGRLPDTVVSNDWVKENVLPALSGWKPEYETLDELLSAFADFYKARKDATVVWHIGHVVEAYLFRLLVEKGYIGEWDAPYCPVEVSSLLLAVGKQPDSVDRYNKEKRLKIPFNGATHHPLYDCAATMVCFFDLKDNPFK